MERRPELETAPRRSARADLLLAAALAALAAMAPIALDALGRMARRGGAEPATSPQSEVLVTQSDGDTVRAWRDRGLRGRTIVHAGRFLHFVDDEIRAATDRLLRTPGASASLDERLVAQAGPRDYLAVASSTGIARRIFYASPPRALEQRLASLGRSLDDLPLRIDAEAVPRTLDAAFPSLPERVLLDVDASWFDGGTADSLLSAMERAGLVPELTTLSLAEDAADVSDRAREELRAFAIRLQGRGLPRAP